MARKNRTSRGRLGRRGEQAAGRYLKRRGYKVMARNVRVSPGEADLLCLAPDRRTVVVVEVKTRRTDPARSAPPPEASVGARKQRTLLKITNWLVRANGWEDRPVRIDVVAVEWASRWHRPMIRHYENAVHP